jgi:hypothetical protein
MVAKKRPCRICRKWFMPSVHEGKRQRVCNSPVCQKERHRGNSRDWRSRHPGWDHAGRLRKRIRVEDTEEAREKIRKNPLAGFQWDLVREAVGPAVAVVVEETCDGVAAFARGMAAERIGPKRGGNPGRLPP